MPIQKAIITAAGFGTRMYPATKSFKKELFPLVDSEGIARPAIWYILKDVFDSGVQEACLIIRKEEEPLFRAYFSGQLPEVFREKLHQPKHRKETALLEEYGKNIYYVYQNHPDGFGHAVYCARDWVQQEPFLLLLGDQVYLSDKKNPNHLSNTCTQQVIEVFNIRAQTIIGVKRRNKSQISLYGTIGARLIQGHPHLYEIMQIQEKPEISFAKAHLRTEGLSEDEYLCFFGIYAFSPSIFDHLEQLVNKNIRERGEIQLTKAIEMLQVQTNNLLALEIQGEFYDLGNPKGYVQAVKIFSESF